MAIILSKGNWFFRLQIEVPHDGSLDNLIIQICHKFGWFQAKEDGEPDYTKFEGEIPGTQILTLPNPNQLEVKYPGITEAMQFLQFVAISEGLEQLAQIDSPPPPEEIVE